MIVQPLINFLLEIILTYFQVINRNLQTVYICFSCILLAKLVCTHVLYLIPKR